MISFLLSKHVIIIELAVSVRLFLSPKINITEPLHRVMCPLECTHTDQLLPSVKCSKSKKNPQLPRRFYISIGKSVNGFLLGRFNLFFRIQEINAKDVCNFVLTRSDKTRDDK